MLPAPPVSETLIVAEVVEPEVTIVSQHPDSIVGEYHVDFAAMDTNDDGVIDAAEASSNPTLTAEFKAVDTDRDGKLSKAELKGWTR
ncbi:EF-hand domain-containing protein [Lysobacter avium]|uniref:EF-hand domain-containing protein n=2 Tax=Lysobacterales TaxID=135614 RepID=A0A7S6UN87_9GAMM|nr:EF-hand domain-containing protein [Lysobacter avium]QOW25867.1 EF-hand domain-containing protein [Lysobacter sp. H23M47]